MKRGIVMLLTTKLAATLALTAGIVALAAISVVAGSGGAGKLHPDRGISPLRLNESLDEINDQIGPGQPDPHGAPVRTVALALSGGDGAARGGASPPSKAQAGHGHNPYAGPVSRTTPAEIISGDSCQLSTSIVWPVRNEWVAGSHRRFTAICAGGAGVDHTSTGRFAILRQNYIRVTQTVDTVDVPGAGPLKITRAPLGRKVQGSAQKRGHLWFVSKNGVHGFLDLSDDTVTITHG